MMDQAAQPIQIEQKKQPSFLAKYKFTILSLCIILIVLIPLLIISQKKRPQPAPVATVQQVVTPTPIPLTQSNVEPTLSATDQQVQDAITQSNQDINQMGQIDMSQDSVAGL